jgi:hypothetical protein
MHSNLGFNQDFARSCGQTICLVFLLLPSAVGFAQTNVAPAGLSSQAGAPQAGVVRARVTQAVDLRDLVTLRGNVHPLARAEYDQGIAPDDLPLERMLLVLQRGADQEAALRQLLEDQQIKTNSQFHQWLTPEDLGRQFGPADADIQAVNDWLATQGFEVNRVAAGRTVIEFSGTAGLVRQALGTEIHKFTVNGEDHWANVSDPQIPAALVPVVAGFASLNNFPRKAFNHSLGTFSRSKLTGEVQPLFTYPVSTCRNGGVGPCYFFAVGPADFATIYNVAPLWSAGTDGTGQTIAVVGESNINPRDVADFRAMFGLPANPPNIILNGPDPGINGDEREADLDVEWSGAVAKGATIDFVSESTETTAGIDLSALYIVDNNLAPIMSESYGACEAELGAAGNQFHSSLWEQAAAQGITVLMAAGDTGSAGCDDYADLEAKYGLGVSGLASTPFNVAVGGTDFNDPTDPYTYWSNANISPSQSSAISYIPESTWNDSCAASGSLTACSPPPSSTYLNHGLYLLAGGGGPSSCINPTGTFPNVTCSGNYSKPSWQSGLGDSARDIPDLSLFAGDGLNFSFYVVCQMDANSEGSAYSCDLNSPYTDFQGGSGTSASVQAFAGIMALVTQKYGRQGIANYVFYSMAAKSGASCNSSTAPVSNSNCVFYDITVGNNSVICQGGSPNCSSSTSGQYGIMVSGGSPAYAATTGFDLATGLGSVNAANLVNNWSYNFTPSTTTLSLSTSPATNPISLTHGQPINFTIKVVQGSGSDTPTGDISLIAQTGNSPSNVTGIGPFTLSGGAVSGSTAMLPGGSFTVTAHYAGDRNFATSDSTPGIPVTVGKESSLTTARWVTFNPTTGAPSYGITTPISYGSPYVLRMDVTDSSGQPCTSPTTGLMSYPCPTGALTLFPPPFEENGTASGSYTLNSQGYAEDQPIQLAPGGYNFVATYLGDNSYTGSVAPALPITVTKAATTTTLTAPASSTWPAIDYSLTVTTQSNGAGPTGTVEILYNGNPLSATSLNATAYSVSTGAYAFGQATGGVTPPPGMWTLTAQYNGDANYAPSTSPPVSVTYSDYSLSANPPAIIISAPGKSGTSTISLTPGGGFTGTVTLSCGVPPYTGLTCSVAPSSVPLTGNSAVPVTFTVTSTSSSIATPHIPQPTFPPIHSRRVNWHWLWAGWLVLMALLGLAKARRRSVVFLFATGALVVVWMACGGSGGGGGGGGAGLLNPAAPPSVSPPRVLVLAHGAPP